MFRKITFALSALTLAAAAHAGTYQVSGYFDNDPSAQVLTGTFSFDDAQVAAGGFDGSFDLTTLDFSFLGQTYSLAQAIGPYVQFDFGMLTGPMASFDTPDGNSLTLQATFGTTFFTYLTEAGEVYGTLDISEIQNGNVPEPASYALVLAALGGGLIARRRRQA